MVKLIIIVGKLQLGNLMLQTSIVIKSKWFELGIALHIPITKLEKVYSKYVDKPEIL